LLGEFGVGRRRRPEYILQGTESQRKKFAKFAKKSPVSNYITLITVSPAIKEIDGKAQGHPDEEAKPGFFGEGKHLHQRKQRTEDGDEGDQRGFVPSLRLRTPYTILY